jgi:hypothetical protein
MTEDEWKQYNANRAVTLDNLIKRHGFDIGQQMWKSYCERQAYAGCKLDYFKEKYGNEEGEKKYNDLIKRKRLTYDNFIRKYGENDGALKWIAYIQKISKTYSAVSQELFRIIDEKYNIARINSHYASKDGTETTLHVPVNGEMKLISLDFTLFNKAIEFYGDFYHANPAKYNASDKIFAKTAADIWEYNNSRVEAVKSAGYDVMIVWEGDFYRNPSEVINKCLKFLKE